jgi:hypothetical protein
MIKPQLPQPIATRAKSLSHKSWNKALGAVISAPITQWYSNYGCGKSTEKVTKK